MEIRTPILESVTEKLKIYDKIEITGIIFTGRDAVLPKLVDMVENGKIRDLGVDIQGGVIFHTAVSPAGIGPTSSNKYDIEHSIPKLSKAGIKIHIGKGSLHPETVDALSENGAIYAVTPPVSALLSSSIISMRILAFPEEGMEAMHILEVKAFPAIVAVAHGKSIFTKKRDV